MNAAHHIGNIMRIDIDLWSINTDATTQATRDMAQEALALTRSLITQLDNLCMQKDVLRHGTTRSSTRPQKSVITSAPADAECRSTITPKQSSPEAHADSGTAEHWWNL